MAACLVMRYILSLLFINACHGGLPGLQDLRDETSITDLHTPQQQLIETVNINKMIVHQPRYKCHMCEPPDCSEQWESQQQCLYCYKSSVRESDGGLRLSRGCSTHSDHYQLTCHTAPALASHTTQHRKRHAAQLNITCCQGELCNDGDFPDLPPIYDTDLELLDEDEGGWRVWMTATASVLTLAVIGACAVFLMRRMHRLRVSRTALHKLGSESGYFPTSLYSNNPYYSEGSWTASAPPINAVAAGDSTLREYLECSVTSGSGSGLPLMVQRTLAKQVTLQDCVGKGRYGEVWRGQWFADEVAVKIFFSRDEASWRRETEIYSTVMLRHENILAYIGSDMTSRNSCTQLWLITHYHPLGSLYDHLNRTALTQRQMLTVCLSTVSGLLHLHTEIHGTEGKPAIAHRDIKSKNILVKSLQGECCIADFGLAVTTGGGSSGASPAQPPLAPLPTNARQGTKRYMSPEMLAETVDTGCVEALRRCDVYALALVAWEAASCTGPAAREYRPPYAERAPPDPTFDDMKRIVCAERARPPLHPHTDKVMIGMNRLMSECWHDNPAVRLPALRIKKTLLKLMAECEAALDL